MMRKIGFMPYKGTIKEVLPSSFKVQMQAQKRQMFLCMLNETLEPSIQIHIKNTNRDLKEIFMKKIFSFFQIHNLAPVKITKIKKFYLKDSLLFEQFFKHSPYPLGQFLGKNWEFDSGFKIQKEYEHPVSTLIKLIFDGKETQMMLDLNALFTQTIFKRIKPSANVKVSLDMPYIHINEKGKTTRLIANWKKLNPSDLSQHKKHISSGFKQLGDEEIDQCYLVYPKTDTFRKHIVLKDNQAHQLKIIPYSFTFTSKMKRVKSAS